jgi:hypothetical protein
MSTDSGEERENVMDDFYELEKILSPIAALKNPKSKNNINNNIPDNQQLP